MRLKGRKTVQKLTKFLQTERNILNLPVSRFPIIVSSPNLDFFQREAEGIIPSFSNLRKSHDRVVCSFLPLFKKTDTTFGCSALIKNKHSEIRKSRTKKNRANRVRN